MSNFVPIEEVHPILFDHLLQGDIIKYKQKFCLVVDRPKYKLVHGWALVDLKTGYFLEEDDFEGFDERTWLVSRYGQWFISSGPVIRGSDVGDIIKRQGDLYFLLKSHRNYQAFYLFNLSVGTRSKNMIEYWNYKDMRHKKMGSLIGAQFYHCLKQ